MENQSVISVILTNRDSTKAQKNKYHTDLNSTNERFCLKECIEDTTL